MVENTKQQIAKEIKKAIAEEESVIVAAYVDPPGASAGPECRSHITTQPHSWASNAVDLLKQNQIEFNGFTSGVRILDASWDSVGGPVVLLQLALDDCFIIYQNRRGMTMSFEFGGLCANVEYDLADSAVMVAGTPAQVCENIYAVGLDMLGTRRGCNPAVEIMIPGANETTKRLRQHLKSHITYEIRHMTVEGRGFLQRPQLTTRYVKKLFPDANFACNQRLDTWLKPSNGNVEEFFTYEQ